MARATSSRTTPEAAASDLAQPLAEWIEGQQRLMSISMDQCGALYEAWMRGWQQQLDAWSALWRGATSQPAAGTAQAPWADLNATYWDGVQRATQAWLGPWQPLLQRGGEQLA